MINVIRSKKIPNSLNTPGIQRYLDDLEVYRVDQQLPAKQRSIVKPKCGESYRNADLFDAFEECFFNKCYLTEKWYLTSYSMDVEHFLPRHEQPELKYVWENLYPADHDANMMKPNRTPSGGYLDPCNPSEDVEEDILYFLDIEGDKVDFDARDKNNTKAVNTALLLQKLHNGDNYDSAKKTTELRTAIQKKYVNVLEAINKWHQARWQQNRDEEFKRERVLRGLLSRKSAYTMIMRSTDAVKDLPDEFFD